jgi:hypothetical protein
MALDDSPVPRAPKPAPDPAEAPKARNTEEQKTDFTAEGSPPPGKVAGAAPPAEPPRMPARPKPRKA